jgi:hypothetical protein
MFPVSLVRLLTKTALAVIASPVFEKFFSFHPFQIRGCVTWLVTECAIALVDISGLEPIFLSQIMLKPHEQANLIRVAHLDRRHLSR